MSTAKVRIFEAATGLYHWCDDNLDYLDERGQGYRGRKACMADAIKRLADSGIDQIEFCGQATMQGRLHDPERMDRLTTIKAIAVRYGVKVVIAA